MVYIMGLFKRIGTEIRFMDKKIALPFFEKNDAIYHGSITKLNHPENSIQIFLGLLIYLRING
jgi:hypothetical protein